MRVAPVFLTQLWGLLCGGALGALRTHQATVHLLAKNRLLDAAGLPPLPGAGHWDIMASSAPAWAGALFFGLSLGLGTGSLCAVWCRLTRGTPGAAGRWLPWLVLALPLPALAAGDPGLAGCVLAVVLGSLAVHRAARQPHPLRWRLALLALCAVGLAPWALAPEGAFTRLRDQVLFASPAGLALDQFYYRWTLYPAEVLKPLAATTQPVAAISPGLSPQQRRLWCTQAQRFGVLCVDAAAQVPGADFTVAAESGATVLRTGGTGLPWPADGTDHRELWQQFSTATDPSGALRRATGLALFVGCPLGLVWLLTSLTLGLAEGFPLRSRRPAAVLLATTIATGVAATGWTDAEIAALRTKLTTPPHATPEDLARHLRSARVFERFYAARSGYQSGLAGAGALLDALGDPVINVRYAAAEAMGQVGGETVRQALTELLQQPEEWYVKERAYAALRRRGWPPP